ncbi:MAG TPA: phosphatase PAP2 family protein [Gemmatimonadales bacterium]
MSAQTAAAHSAAAIDSLPNAGWRDLAIGGGIITGAFLFDAPIGHYFDGPHSSTATSAARNFQKFGEITGIGAVIGGLGVAAIVTRNHHLAQATLRTAAGLALASGVTQGLKYAVGRQRPYLDPDRDATDFHWFAGTPSGSPSFPSGHTETAFALATSLGDAIDRTWARVALYGLATGTGWARMQQEQHWLSDIVAGAGVGILAAKFADGRLRLFGMRAPRVLLSAHSAGVRWMVPIR